jgi:hypothetical protein
MARAVRDLIILRLLTVAVSRSRRARGSVLQHSRRQGVPGVQLIFENTGWLEDEKMEGCGNTQRKAAFCSHYLAYTSQLKIEAEL